jgi:serine protease
MMPRAGTCSRVCAALGALAALSSLRTTVAQSDATPFPVMSAERVAALIEAADRKLDYLPGEVLIKFRDGVSRSGQQRALMALRSRPDADQMTWIGSVALLRDASQPNARILAEQLSSQPEVEYAEPNYLRRVHATPNDPLYSRQWNLSSLNMPGAWDIGGGGSSELIVAVVDTGVTVVPPQNLNARTWNGTAIVTTAAPVAPSPDFNTSRFVSPRDFTGPSPTSFVVDTEGHGTHVAGTLAEESNNSLGLAGMAYNARIMPVKVCMSDWDVQFAMSAAGVPGFADFGSGGCATSDIIAGIRYAADNGAKVINFSIGGPQASQAERDAFVYAVSRGAFVAISNGNEFLEGNAVSYPAGFAPQINGAMSVAATSMTRGHASYSSTGPHTEISAPGGDFRDGGPTGQIWQFSLNDDASFEVLFPRFDRYVPVNAQGTSMASPHVAGAAALLWSRGIRNPATIETLLRQTAADLGAAGKDNTFGYGLVQPRAALYGMGIRR